MIWSIPFLLLKALAVTVASEILTALFMGVRGRMLITILLVNVITNPILNYILIARQLTHVGFPWGLLIILEIVVAVVEGLVYGQRFRRKGYNPYLMSILMNSVSLVFGLIII